jgi:hypothetical protein
LGLRNGGSVFDARGVGASMFTEVDDLDQLRDEVRDAVRCHSEDADRPQASRLHWSTTKSSPQCRAAAGSTRPARHTPGTSTVPVRVRVPYLSFVHSSGMTMATPSTTPRGRTAPADAPPALSPATMATLRALVAAQVGPSWMEWFALTPGQRAAALAATPSLTSELRDGA